MADTVFFIDGSMDTVVGDKGAYLESLLRERLGDDVARFFREYVAEELDGVNWAKEAQREAESAADHYHRLCTDALDAFTQITRLLQQPRLSRLKLQEAVDAGYNDLYKNL